MKLRKFMTLICALLMVSGTGCSLIDFKDEPEQTSAETTTSVTLETTTETTVVEETVETSAPVLESNLHLPTSVPGNLITEINSQTIVDCSLTSHDFVGSVSQDRIAVLRMNYNGSRPIDSEITTIESSEIIYRDLDGNLLNTISIDSIYIPRIRFDFDGNIHVFIWDGETTFHSCYDVDGNEIDDMSFTMDCNPLEIAFDSDGYMYINYYDWTDNKSMVAMYSPVGDLIAVRSEFAYSLITINQVPYNVRQSGNASFITLVPTAEYVQDLDFERITLHDITGITPISGYGGFYYFDSMRQRLCAYDVDTETSYVLQQNVGLNYETTWQIDDEIITAAAFEKPIIYR